MVQNSSHKVFAMVHKPARTIGIFSKHVAQTHLGLVGGDLVVREGVVVGGITPSIRAPADPGEDGSVRRQGRRSSWPS